jgi:hypothetical protein
VSTIDLQRETEEKARQPETKLSATAQHATAEGWARPRIGARPAARVATYAPDRHRDAVSTIRFSLEAGRIICNPAMLGNVRTRSYTHALFHPENLIACITKQQLKRHLHSLTCHPYSLPALEKRHRMKQERPISG